MRNSFLSACESAILHVMRKTAKNILQIKIMKKNIAYNIDCMEYMKNIPDQYFDLAIVDPPYGNAGKDFKRTDKSRFGGKFDKYTKVPVERERERETQRGRNITGLTDTKVLTRTGGTWATKFGKKL